MPELEQEYRYSPYFAGIWGKTEDEIHALELRIDELPDLVREFVMKEDTDAQLRGAMRDAGVPEQYSVALAKIIFLITLGDVPADSVETLLQKLKLDQVQSRAMAVSLSKILAPIISMKAAASIPRKLPSVPPLTVQRPSPMGSIGKPRNIIDLRKPPEAI